MYSYKTPFKRKCIENYAPSEFSQVSALYQTELAVFVDDNAVSQGKIARIDSW